MASTPTSSAGPSTRAGFKVALSGVGGDEAVGGYSHFRLLKYLPMLRAMDAVPLPVGVMAAKLAGTLGGAKASRLLGRHGPRSGAGLALLQRELFPASLVSEPDRSREQPDGRDRGPGGLATRMFTTLLRSHGRRRGRDLLAGHVAS